MGDWAGAARPIPHFSIYSSSNCVSPKVKEGSSAAVIFGANGCEGAGKHTLHTAGTARRVDVRGLIGVYADDGASVTYPARLARLAHLAGIPIDYRYDHSARNDELTKQ